MVQGEKWEKLRRRGEGFVVRECLLVLLSVFLVCLDVLAIEMLYHVDVKGYASPVAVAGPLRVLNTLVDVAAAGKGVYHLPGSLICLDIIMLVQIFHLLLLQPMFGVGELANCAVDVKLSRSKVPSGGGQHCRLRRKHRHTIKWHHHGSVEWLRCQASTARGRGALI